MGKFSLEEVNSMYMDVLKEIGNIGAGNATTAIARMIGARIDMNVPNVKLLEVSELGTAVGAEDDTIIGIFLEVCHDIEGSMMFLRVIIDKEGGIDIEDCVTVSRLINPILDQEDPIEENYILDVCSKEGSE